MSGNDSQPILFPTDFSGASTAAFEYAQGLAAQAGARILVLHVATIPDTRGTQLGHSYHDDLRVKLNQVVSQRAEVDRLLVVADPGPEICQCARDHNCELIVMGLADRSGVEQLGFGSVHDYVIRNAPCTVISSRHHVIKAQAQPEAAGRRVPGLNFSPAW